MKKCAWLIFLLISISATVVQAQFDFIFTQNDNITEEQWNRYLNGALLAYNKSFEESQIKDIFSKMKCAGRDVMEMTKNGQYFGHVFLVEQQLHSERILRLGMFGFNDKKDFPEFSVRMMHKLAEEYKDHDFSCGCPTNNFDKLGKLIMSLGFKEDSSVAEDPNKMMELYNIDTKPGNYIWFRFSNKSH